MKHLLILVLIPLVVAHSWVACMDYDLSAPNDVNYYNPAKCTGFGRGWSNACERTNNQFGLDCGYNYQPGNGAVCSNRLNPTNYDASYSQASKMSTYAPGERVCLAWPAKNHVAASCANRFIPDFGTKLYMSGPNPQADPANMNALRSSATLVKDFGRNSAPDALQGFQNCPKFCENNDKCLCTGCFNVPTNVQTGAVYSFFWAWAFNGENDVYTTCWEAKIAGNAQTPTPNPTNRPSTNVASSNAVASSNRVASSAPIASSAAPTPAGCNNPFARGTGNGLVGQYFKGTNFNQYILSKTDPIIAFDFGLNAPPNSGLDVNFWTIRWVGNVQPRFSGQWTFYVISDDGCRLWIQSQMLINDFTGHGRLQKSGNINLNAGQFYGLKLDYLEIDQSANINLQWSHQCQTQQDIPTSQLYATPNIGFDTKCAATVGVGKGLTARYFNPNTTEPVATQVEGPNDIREDVVPQNLQPLYKVEWTGFILPSFDEQYTFTVSSANGVRLTIDNSIVVEDVVPHMFSEKSGNITLSSGKAVPIKLEYWSNGANTDNTVALRWYTPECLGDQFVPKTNLYVSLEEIPTEGGDQFTIGEESSAATLFAMISVAFFFLF